MMCASFVLERRLWGYLTESVDSAKKNIKDMYFLFNAIYLNYQNFSQYNVAKPL